MIESEGGFTRDPAAFNAKAHSLANDRRHAQGEGIFPVTAESHPTLFEVFEAISHDNGGSAGHDSYSVPIARKVQAERCDRLLASFTPEDRQTIAIGDQGEAGAILDAKCRHAEERDMVDDLLGAFFEDWSEDGGVG